MKPDRNSLLLAVLCVFAPIAAQALSTDQNQPINIQADRVSIHEKRGYSEYAGSVEMTQGSMRLKADRVIIHQHGGHLQKVDATGNPAHFSQLPDGSEVRVEAEAKTIEYDAATGELVLKGGARVVQGANTFTGERIEYNTHNATVSASKGETGQGRVRATIEPPGKKRAPAGQSPRIAPKSRNAPGKKP